ncbi:glycolipid transfer protein HET-C2 [Lineolata rhizophorae]|uniref:Glycolipid transfer protein HET-C2 n=1 Tax=Lineolata rhizophorae TaxID=578093 RepID=A0A6A6NXJ8_9PEZI|nr:glycolipid transfer protein HET-C2 [Lineolata rhizophorae]
MAAPPSIPPGGTFFDTLKKNFKDVPVDADNGIHTTEFLEAAESLTTLFDVLGSVAFTPVKSDMLGNVKKIRDRQVTVPAESETLQALVDNELKAKKITASGGLLWLTRGLDFTAQSLRQNVTNSSEELSASFRAAYSNTLKPHHSFVVKPIFSAAMSATPYRKDFYAKLGSDQAKVSEELETWLGALENIVKILTGMLETHKDALKKA